MIHWLSLECWGVGKAATNPLDFILFQALFLEGVKRLLWTERKGGKKKKGKLRRYWAWSKIAPLYFVILFHSRMVSDLVCSGLCCTYMMGSYPCSSGRKE